jgi:peptide/nickel transport system substrate-binding protein
MQNRFGLKDFVLLILLIGVGVSVWISMVQEDRRWVSVREVQQQVQRVEQQVSILSQRLEEGIVVTGAGPGGAPAARDESWARPGVEINWQEPMRVVNDPRYQEGFAAGGRFKETFNAQPSTITPYIYRDVYALFVIDQVVESLGKYHPDELYLQGVLAEAWQTDPDGLWLRALIRRNARFSDGKPVTADDVIFSFDLLMNPEVEAERSRANYGLIERIEKIDTRVVEFHFHEPMFVNVERAMYMPILPKHFYENFTSSQLNQSTSLLMGSGPFRLRTLDPDNQWRPGHEDIVLVRNEQYWGPRPALDELRFDAISDDLARITAFNNRETDLTLPSSRQFVSYRTRDDWNERNAAMMWYNIRGGYSFIAWNGGRPPFNDARVRKAMTHLLDRQWIIDNILEGIGEVATGPFNPRTDQANPDISPWPYSLERARELLAEAGWTPDEDGVLRNDRGDRFSFVFTFSTGSEATRQVAQYLVDQSARVGIRCTLRPVDWAIFSDIHRQRDFDALTMGWAPSTPEGDPYQIWHSDNIPAGGDNFAQWRSERGDWLIENGRREMDPDKRREMWHELHALLHQDQPYTFLAVRPWLRFVNRRTHNVHPYLTGIEYREFFIPVQHQASPM